MVAKAKATSFDVAYKAGVSQATVSRALSGSPLVSEETRKRIRTIAQELNYKVDKHASALRRQHAATLAVLLFEDPTSDNSWVNPFFLSMFGHMTHATARLGYDLLVSFQQQSQNWHADFLDNRKADGLILLGYGDYQASRHLLEELQASGTPFVRWGGIPEDPFGITINCDNSDGGRQAAAHLLKKGRHRLAFIGRSDSGAPEFAERFAGFCQAHKDAEVTFDPALMVTVVDSIESEGERAVSQLLAQSRERGLTFDGICAASDLLAIGAMRSLIAAGVQVPRDVAIMGFDDIPSARYSSPALSTVQQDTQKAGELLVELLIRQINGEKVANCSIPAPLVVRESCGGP